MKGGDSTSIEVCLLVAGWVWELIIRGGYTYMYKEQSNGFKSV